MFRISFKSTPSNLVFMAGLEDRFLEKDRKYISKWGHELKVPESVYGLLYSADPEFLKSNTIESARKKRDILIEQFPKTFGKGSKQDLTSDINNSAKAVSVCERYRSIVDSYKKKYPNVRTWKD